MSFDATQLLHQLPLLTVALFAVALLLFEAFTRGDRAGAAGSFLPIALLGCGVALLFTLHGAKSLEPRALYGGLLVVDAKARFFEAIFLFSAMLALLFSRSWLHEHERESGEFYALVLLAVAGMMILASAADLVTVFLGLETMSLAVYVLCGLRPKVARSAEAAFKYYLVGAFSAAILLFGIALLYGATGTTSLEGLARQAQRASGDPIFIVGLVLLLAGLAYKVAAVPFHMWTPDAYEGAPTPVTAFMAAGVKAAAFAALLRVVSTAFVVEAARTTPSGWVPILQILAALSMTVGNLAALRQTNVKRLLAYSAIAHAGYILVGVVASGIVGSEAHAPVLYYLLAYAVSTLGAFGVVAWLGRKGDERLQLDDWAGLASRHPAVALAMTLFLLSLASVPPTAGFFAKFHVLRAAVKAPELYVLVVIAVLNSAVAVYYYLRIITTMYFREVIREPAPIRSTAAGLALLVAALLVIHMGLMPGPYLLAAGQ